MMRLLSEDLPFFMLYFSVQVQSHATELRGPEAGLSSAGVLIAESLPYWNTHEWELCYVRRPSPVGGICDQAQ